MVLLPVSCFCLFGCASRAAITPPVPEALPGTEQTSTVRPPGPSPAGSSAIQQSNTALQKPDPLTSSEVAQLEDLFFSTRTFGIEFPYCHQDVVLSRWGGKVRGRDHIPTEQELLHLETIEQDEPLLAPRLAEGYVKLVYSTWRDLLEQYFRVDGRDPARVRQLLVRRQRVEPKLLQALRRASATSREHGKRYRYELALHYLMFRDYTAAREAASPLLNGAWQPHGKQAALLVAMSYLEIPAATDDLQRARSLLMRVASANDRSPHTVIASCFLAEVHASLGDMRRALDEWRLLRDAHDPFGLWRVAQHRLNELEQDAP